MNLSLSKDQVSELIEAAKRDVVSSILTEHRADLTLVSAQQVAGMLDVAPATLASMKIPRVVLIPKKVVKYRLADVVAFINSNLEK